MILVIIQVPVVLKDVRFCMPVKLLEMMACGDWNA